MADPHVRLRADAQANRERILDIARDAFAADPAVSLNAIAKAAGVGAGTLYRHFPSREALLVGVYRKEIDALVGLAPDLLARHAPLHALRLWCDRFVRFGEVKHGVADTLSSAISEDDLRETYRPMVGAVRQLLEACEERGEIHSGVHPEDVLTLLALLLRISPTSDGKAQVRRILALLFRGLGVDSLSPP
ncbi:TetR/AcrR family transcriptional regulator [Komagataeibacter nataicola]|uniref:TetR/AcrR family transcriptional regulator n=1 Tax=Komagataeibacter nataicola TaxID=265960 RepID=UPI0014744FCD|nr:TetR family transcriptional regulator [Komagataeibacter nataicola]WNM07577.1 TetR/AcrR family transcriptional regulator [Komagataeibacter nataicola]GBR25672.1 transcriptional regulator [Komagataeibacter nataicola NRIC 0616]